MPLARAEACLHSVLMFCLVRALHSLLGTNLVSCKVCTSCGKSSLTKEDNNPGFCLEMNSHPDLQACVQEFFGLELLTEDNSMFCDSLSCSRVTSAKSRLAIGQLPKVLTLNLKRFSFDRRTKKVKKIDRRCFVNDELDVGPYLVGNDREKARYRFKAAVLHHGGSVKSGHYTALLRDARGYVEVDDQQCAAIRLGPGVPAKLHTSGYLLFYEKCEDVKPPQQDDSWWSSFMQKQPVERQKSSETDESLCCSVCDGDIERDEDFVTCPVCSACLHRTCCEAGVCKPCHEDLLAFGHRFDDNTASNSESGLSFVSCNSFFFSTLQYCLH